MALSITRDRLSFSSQIENLAVVENLIDQLCEDYKVSEDYYGNIIVAVSEAVINAIEHGNCGDPNKQVDVAYEAGETNLQFVIRDEGEGFDFTNLPDPTDPENIEKPNGRGIFLMKNLADGVEFKEEGRVVELEFHLASQTNAN